MAFRKAKENKAMNTIKVNDRATLDALYNNSALTFEGVAADEENITARIACYVDDHLNDFVEIQ